VTDDTKRDPIAALGVGGACVRSGIGEAGRWSGIDEAGRCAGIGEAGVRSGGCDAGRGNSKAPPLRSGAGYRNRVKCKRPKRGLMGAGEEGSCGGADDEPFGVVADAGPKSAVGAF
jgi:hypothetical protein